MKWIKKEIEENEKFRVFFTEFINGLIIFLSDSENKFGTIGIGVPLSPQISNRGSSTSPIVFGIKNELIVKSIASKIAQATKKIVILIINISEENLKDIDIVLKSLSSLW